MFDFEVKYDVSYLNTLVHHEHQLTPAELAGIIGYSRSHIYKVLNFSQKPTDRFIQGIINGLNLNMVEQMRLKYSIPVGKAKLLAEHFMQLDYHALLITSNY